LPRPLHLEKATHLQLFPAFFPNVEHSTIQRHPTARINRWFPGIIRAPIRSLVFFGFHSLQCRSPAFCQAPDTLAGNVALTDLLQRFRRFSEGQFPIVLHRQFGYLCLPQN
jgi:hypothetical protein